MKDLKYFLCLFFVALLPVSAHAQKELERVYQQFISTSAKGKTVTEQEVISDKADGRRPFSFSWYNFTLKNSALKYFQPLLSAFRTERSNAYYVYVKPAGQKEETPKIIDMDNRRVNLDVGFYSDRNYHELCFEDTKNPDYRYAYILVYWQKSEKAITGELVKVYSIRPDIRSQIYNNGDKYRNNGNRKFYYRDGKYIIVSPDGNWSIDGQLYNAGKDTNSVELNDRMQVLNKEMKKLNLRMQELSQGDLDANADKMSLIGDSMRMVGDSMRVVGDLMREEGFKISTLINDKKDSLTTDNNKLRRKFGIYYSLYKNYKQDKADDSKLTSVANLIYELVDQYSKGKKDPQMDSLFKMSLNELSTSEKDPYRKGLLQMAMKKLN